MTLRNQERIIILMLPLKRWTGVTAEVLVTLPGCRATVEIRAH